MSKIMPKVSVIIPVYSVEKHIERCARSLFEQTLKDIEYIFIDDCTPDKSIDILKEVLDDYPERKPQVIIHKMESNCGQAMVRKWGMLHASGEYMIHCDSDDWVDSEMYKDLYAKAINETADIVICDLQSHNGISFQKKIVGCISIEKKRILSDLLYQKISSSLCNKLIKRELINAISIFPEDNMGEDMLLCLQLLYSSRKITFISKPYYYYYKNSESITKKGTLQSYIDRFNQFQSNTNKMIAFLSSISEQSNYQKEINWLKYSVKSCLGSHYAECRMKWRETYPLIEFKVLFDRAVSKERRCNCLKSIIKNYSCL